jgi:hypothetical protein
LSKPWLSATGKLVLVQTSYGNEALNRSKTFRWYTGLRERRERVEDDESGGRPKSTRTEVNIAAVADLLKNDLRIASRIIAESLIIRKSIVLRILKEDWRKRKLCARFVPLSLTPEQSGRSSLILPRNYRYFFNKIITGNETWGFAYDPETKRQNSEWAD